MRELLAAIAPKDLMLSCARSTMTDLAQLVQDTLQQQHLLRQAV